MPKSLLGDLSVPVPCPKCGKKTNQKVSRLKNNPTFTCSGCGNVVQVDSGNLGGKVGRVDKIVDDLGKKNR